MHQKQKYIYVGLDLHKSTHTAVILDCWNKKLGEITIENKPSEFPRFMKEIKKYSKKLEPIYGLEDEGANGFKGMKKLSSLGKNMVNTFVLDMICAKIPKALKKGMSENASKKVLLKP